MGATATSKKDMEIIWSFYLENQKPRMVRKRCEAAGIKVHPNTISRWIHKGIPAKGIPAFKDRLAEIRGTAERVLREKKAERVATKPVNVEVIEQKTPAARHMIDQFTAQYLAEGLEAYQALVDRTILHGHIGLERVMDCLMGADPEDARAIKDATAALKNMVASIKEAVETRASLRGMGLSTDPDEPGIILLEHFEGWTPEEHKAFREDGIWPESQGPAPKFLLPAGEDTEDEETN